VIPETWDSNQAHSVKRQKSPAFRRAFLFFETGQSMVLCCRELCIMKKLFLIFAVFFQLEQQEA